MLTAVLLLQALCAAKAPSHIYFAQDGSIGRVDLDGGNYAVLHAGLGSYSDVAVDEQRGNVFFISNGGGGVFRTGLAGREATRIVSTCLPGDCTFRGLAVELASGDIFYGVKNENSGYIRRAASDGRNVVNVAQIEVDNFALSADGSAIFADALYESRWTVVRLDVASREVIGLIGDRRTFWMEQVAFDPVAGKVYCQSAPQNQNWGSVLTRVNPDGSALELLSDGEQLLHGMAVDGVAQRIYVARSITTAGQLLGGPTSDLPPTEVLFYPDTWMYQLALDGYPDPVADAGVTSDAGAKETAPDQGCECQQSTRSARSGALLAWALLLMAAVARQRRSA